MASPVKIFDINIMQWNSQSIRPKSVEFQLLLSQEKVHIAFLSETWLEPDSPINFPGYNVFRKDRHDSYGGVAILVHKSINAHEHPTNFNNPDIGIIHVSLINCKCLKNIISIYCPSSVRTTQNDWEDIFGLCSQGALVTGDFNGHHTNWSYKSDARGIQILDAALENGFVSLNDGSPTRVKLVNGRLQESSPDITFSSTDITVNFIRWAVSRESLGSDHLIIQMKFSYCDSIKLSIKRNFKLANWKSYRSDLDDKFSNHNSDLLDNVQLKYNYFVDNINVSADKNIPLSKICNNPDSKFKPKNYWNADLSKIVAERRLALKNFRKNPTPYNLTLLEAKISEAQRNIRKAKSRSWHEFCNKVDETTSASDMWRQMQWMKGFRQSRTYVSNENKTKLLCALTPDSVSVPFPACISSNDKLEATFSLQELNHAINKKKKDTSPGSDKITYSMIKHLPSNGKQYLLNLYNLIFSSGLIPIQWRSVLIVPIPKQNLQRSEIKLRPIALISCLCKILNDMLCKRLEWFVEKQNILSRSSSGFRRAQSSLDPLVRLVTHIQIGFSKNVPTLACFLDIENAYNNVLVEKLVTVLDDLKVGKAVCRYLWELLSERHLNMMVTNDDPDSDTEKSISRWTNRGLAQGDPISPLLFNIVTAKIGNEINDVFIYQYADDFVLYQNCCRLEDSGLKLQTALNTIVLLLEDIGLQLSTNKTKACTFSRGRRRKEVELKIYGSRVNFVNCIKYLGLWLDNTLRWGKHINEIVQKTQKHINILKILSGSGWGIHPRHLRRLYISLIRSRMDYGCFLYDSSAKSNVYKLEKIQNSALRIIGGFIRSTPIHVMESELCIYPLHLRRLYLAYKYGIKAQSWSNNISIKLLTELNDLCDNRYWQSKKKPLLSLVFDRIKEECIHSCYPLLMFSLDTWVTNINVSNIICTKLDNLDGPKSLYNHNVLKNNVLNEIENKYGREWHRIYTDGSKTANEGGAAFCNLNGNVQRLFKIKPDEICIMTIELLAISEALSYAEELEGNTIILTDSKSALQHLNRCATGQRGFSISYIILEKIQKLQANNKQLRLQWIPSHVGLRGNEEADRLAKLAASDGTETFIEPDYSEKFNLFKKVVYDEWKEYFNERSKEKGIWYKAIQSEPPRIPWFGDIKINRSEVVLAHRLRSGHIPLNRFAYLMKKVDSPNCDVCGVLEDVQHLLAECVRIEAHRESFLRYIGHSSTDVGVYNSILAMPWSETARRLYKIVNIYLDLRNNLPNTIV